MCNECSICFDDNAKCKLVCGHIFHHGCIKEWYMTGNNATMSYVSQQYIF